MRLFPDEHTRWSFYFVSNPCFWAILFFLTLTCLRTSNAWFGVVDNTNFWCYFDLISNGFSVLEWVKSEFSWFYCKNFRNYRDVMESSKKDKNRKDFWEIRTWVRVDGKPGARNGWSEVQEEIPGLKRAFKEESNGFWKRKLELLMRLQPSQLISYETSTLVTGWSWRLRRHAWVDPRVEPSDASLVRCADLYKRLFSLGFSLFTLFFRLGRLLHQLARLLAGENIKLKGDIDWREISTPNLHRSSWVLRNKGSFYEFFLF